MPSNAIGTLNIFGAGSENLNFHSEFDEYTGFQTRKHYSKQTMSLI